MHLLSKSNLLAFLRTNMRTEFLLLGNASLTQHFESNKSVFSFLRQLTTWRCPHLLQRAVLRRGCC